MTETLELNQIDVFIEASIKNAQTHAYKAKDIAADLRYNGFDGAMVADLIENLELSLKNAHMYQAYINCQNTEE